MATGGAILLARGRATKPRRRLTMLKYERNQALAKIPEPEEDLLGEGDVCSLWNTHQAEIDTELLGAPWASLMDKVATPLVDQESKRMVRGCRKGAKQVATIGPASAEEAMLERLFLCGVDVFRLNFSHGEHSEKVELIQRIRSLEEKYMHPICILADMQGPKQRCGKFANPDGVELQTGAIFRLDLDPALGDEQRVQLPHPEILIALRPGKMLLLDDGKLRMRVVRAGCIWKGEEITVKEPKDRPSENPAECPPFVECMVEVGGHLSARKGVNTPDVILPISPITPKDRKDIEFACKNDVDWIAMSFVQKHEDMQELRKLVDSFGGSRLKLLAKIEKPAAVDDLDKILAECDGVMVARGDLGVEMNPEEVPFVQKTIISKANRAGKPVIVATQMLESMITNPSPTRAECSDVANAILDGCDAVMLSGETAVGKYPAECVEMQRRVINASERSFQPQGALPSNLQAISEENAIAASAATLAQGIGAKAILCFTSTGKSVQQLVHLRPSVPILAVCACLETARWLSLLRGVYATSDAQAQALAARVLSDGKDSVIFTEGVEVACKVASERGLATKKDDSLVVIARLPLFTPGPLNVICLADPEGPKEHGYKTP